MKVENPKKAVEDDAASNRDEDYNLDPAPKNLQADEELEFEADTEEEAGYTL